MKKYLKKQKKCDDAIKNWNIALKIDSTKTELIKDKLTDELRNSLWTVMCITVFELLSNDKGRNESGYPETYSKLASFYRSLWK